MLRWLSPLVLGFFVIGAAPAAAAKDAFKISGFVGKTRTEPASGSIVRLLDGESGKVLDMAQVGFFAKFEFKNLKPGLYVLQAGDVKVEVLLKDKDKRQDIDLSSKDGRMSRIDLGQVTSTLGGAGGAPAAGPAPGPNDPNLMQAMAASYWGYTGSTETSLTLCSNGVFSDSSESSYSGQSRDSLGNQTMAWGTAGQRGGSGNWSVQGSAQQGTINLSYSGGKRVTVPYRAVDNQGCYSFEGKTLCRKGPANCQ
ncbi:MAG: hypothetical protein AAB225_11365 [Acidobacteriota bacterium]